MMIFKGEFQEFQGRDQKTKRFSLSLSYFWHQRQKTGATYIDSTLRDETQSQDTESKHSDKTLKHRPKKN